jgi:transcriptional regulator with XRE-family HTH domain
MKLNVEPNTVWKWEKGVITPSIDSAQKIADFFNVPVDELLNGPAQKEIEVRIVIRESDQEVGNVKMDLSKDAPFLQLVEIGQHKTGLNIVFGPEKTLREVCEEILAKEEKFELAREAVYGN